MTVSGSADVRGSPDVCLENNWDIGDRCSLQEHKSSLFSLENSLFSKIFSLLV